jgi:hypothetical protein
MTAEIESLISEFNTAAGEQKARLMQLFELVRARSGYRRIRFGREASGIFTGWVGFDYELSTGLPDFAKFVDKITPPVYVYNLGDD